MDNLHLLLKIIKLNCLILVLLALGIYLYIKLVDLMLQHLDGVHILKKLSFGIMELLLKCFSFLAVERILP